MAGFEAALHERVRAAQKCTDPAPLATLVVESTMELMEAEAAELVWWDGELASLGVHTAGCSEASPDMDTISGSVSTAALQARRTMVIDDYRAWPEAGHDRISDGFRAAAGAPALVGGQAPAALGIYRQEGRPISSEEVQRLELVAASLGATFVAVRLRRSCAEKRERLGLILASAPILQFTIDRGGAFTSMRGKGLELVNLPESFFLGRQVTELYRDNPEFVPAIAQALAGEQTHFDAISSVSGRHWDYVIEPLRDDRGDVQGATA